jgi:hypothetical protein
MAKDVGIIRIRGLCKVVVRVWHLHSDNALRFEGVTQPREIVKILVLQNL